VEARWGLRFHGYFSTGSEAFVSEDGSAFVPRTRAALFGSDAGLVLAFRGSEPTNLINLRSAGRHARCWWSPALGLLCGMEDSVQVGQSIQQYFARMRGIDGGWSGPPNQP
jgi:hypothetical protein